MAALTVLVPVYDEAEWFDSGNFASKWGTIVTLESLAVFRRYAIDGCCLDLRFCLWPSHDDSLASSTLLKFFSQLPATISAQLFLANNKSDTELLRPSVVASLELGLQKKVTSQMVMVCPIDCALSPAAWAEVLEFALTSARSSAQQRKKHQWGVFPKHYAGEIASLPLACSAWLQNKILSPILGIHCWTNLFVLPSDAIGFAFQRLGFLEDLRANKVLLRLHGRPKRFVSCALVSPRRYLRRGPLLQIRMNISIFLRYVFLKDDSSAANLRRLHDGTDTVQS